MLFAPSFDFVENRRKQLGDEGLEKWKKTGYLPWKHYDFKGEFRLHNGIVEDFQKYEKYPCGLGMPIYAIHGRQDTTVNPQQTVTYAKDNPNVILQMIDGDHSLSTAFEFLWQETYRFFELAKYEQVGL